MDKKTIKTNKPKKLNTKKSNSSGLNILMALLTVLAHVVIIYFIISSYRYYGIQLATFVGIIIAIVCLLAIVDILLFVALKYKDVRVKIINIVLSVLLLIVGSVGSFYIGKVNKTVDNIIENDGTDQYETISGVFTYYKKDSSSKTYDDLDDLKSASNLKIGIVSDSGVGTGTLAKQILEDNGISADITEYSADILLFEALVGDDEDIDVAVFPASLRQRLSSDTDVDYEQYLENMVDFYSFEEKVKVGENENANKDLSTDPFNILLIGFAPEDEAQTVGLADTIIVATVNPQTFTVSLTSIARDSYVELACATGTRQKINAARGISRQCLMDTVADLMDIDIDYYMEVNFTGVVKIVDALGGVVINSPVAFTGQTASGIRGQYTVYVPAGEYLANGEQALAYARERHAMPNGDFDRQQHQQEVIKEIVHGLINLNDVNKALDVMEAAGDNLSTNLSLKQLTGIFSYLINHEDNTGIQTFYMIDIQNMRVTGYASWYYSYSMRLPQWIYKLYNGSIQECKDRIKDVMLDYEPSEITQINYQKFFVEYPYSRGQLYSSSFNEAEEHEQMPAYYPYLTNMTYLEALEWASANGVKLNVTFIDNNSSSYVASRDGEIISQSPRQGALVSEYPSGSITVMGNQDANYDPEFTVEGCDDEASCFAWASNNNLTIENATKFDSTMTQTEGTFAGTSVSNGGTIKKSQTFYMYYWTRTIPSPTGYTYDQYVTLLQGYGLKVVQGTNTTTTDTNLIGTVASYTPTTLDKTFTVTVSKYVSSSDSSNNNGGGNTSHDHVWVNKENGLHDYYCVDGTTTQMAKQDQYCSVDGCTETRTIDVTISEQSTACGYVAPSDGSDGNDSGNEEKVDGGE